MSSPTVTQTSKLVRNSRRHAQPSQAQVDTMAESISALGMIVKPLEVRRVGDGYEIIDGEVRWLAAKQLSIDIVPILVIPIGEHESAAASLILNMDRESIAPEEVLSSLERLYSEFGADAAETIKEKLSELQNAAESNPELRGRINALLASCNIDSQV
ncbi:ParB-like protein [Ectopseudomonas oleovorans]|uniref:ParB-like protein n=1 Tax=Ectopseudomonas oleovorans TaxID=301 RepID=A0A379JZG5_ECTOL|nr:ParB/RepB/Spo0J family partition protein [Pseudomonas oleovorans]SUD57905.1 ParB-like protein [Pseudomonas oleovorans]